MTNGDQHDRNRFLDLAMIVVFDIAGPLVAYSLLRSAGQSAVTALVLSGAFPALGVIVSLIRHRRADTIGVLVLAGIAVGTVVGLLSGDPRLVLVEGSVPTAVFGFLCLGSLWARRPLIYRFAVEFIGADTPKGRDFASLWQYPGFRHRLPALHRGVGRRVSGRGGGQGHHRRDDLDQHRADCLQGDALRGRRRHHRVDDPGAANTRTGWSRGPRPRQGQPGLACTTGWRAWRRRWRDSATPTPPSARRSCLGDRWERLGSDATAAWPDSR